MTTAKHCNNTELVAYTNSVCSLCRFLCVCYCVRAPQWHDSDLFYLTQVSQTRDVFPFITRHKKHAPPFAQYLLHLQTFTEESSRQKHPYVLFFWLKFLLSLWISFINKKVLLLPKGGHISVQGWPKMAPLTTGLEAGSGTTHTASHSDLGEKQPFKQVACLSARGECQPLVLP